MDRTPLIDLGIFYAQPAAEYPALLRTVNKACRELGFFRICNHGVPVELQAQIIEATRNFYDLPLEKKAKLSLDKSVKKRGYSALYQQQLDPKGTPDYKESFYLSENSAVSGNQYPEEDDIPGFRQITSIYYSEMIKLSQTLFRLLADSLNLPHNTFDEYSGADGSLSGTEGSTVRLVHYPPLQEKSDVIQYSCGGHTDFGTITILLQDEIPGLQILDPSTKEWYAVPPGKGVLVVNIGDLMQRWTNDIYISASHRVEMIGARSRYSVPFFFNGNHGYTINCLPADLNTNESKPGMTPGKYPPITVGEHIRRRLEKSHVDLEGRKA